MRRILGKSFATTTGGGSKRQRFGEREALAAEYLQFREWTVETLLANRAATKSAIGFSQQIQVNWISEECTVEKAVREMVSREIGSMIVFEEEEANPTPHRCWSGIVTERDYLRKVLVRNLSSRTTLCGEIMTPRSAVTTVSLHSTLYDCLDAFEHGSFRHLPVVVPREDLGSGKEEVVAVFSQRDLIYEFKKFHEVNLKYLESFIDFPIW